MATINPLRGVCCVCGTIYREGALPASHGLCEECSKDYRKALERRKAELAGERGGRG